MADGLPSRFIASQIKLTITKTIDAVKPIKFKEASFGNNRIIEIPGINTAKNIYKYFFLFSISFKSSY